MQHSSKQKLNKIFLLTFLVVFTWNSYMHICIHICIHISYMSFCVLIITFPPESNDLKHCEQNPYSGQPSGNFPSFGGLEVQGELCVFLCCITICSAFPCWLLQAFWQIPVPHNIQFDESANLSVNVRKKGMISVIFECHTSPRFQHVYNSWAIQHQHLKDCLMT